MNENLLDTNEAAALLRLQPVTLKKWRSLGMGPAYIKVGRKVFYHRTSLASFLERGTIDPEATGDIE